MPSRPINQHITSGPDSELNSAVCSAEQLICCHSLMSNVISRKKKGGKNCHQTFPPWKPLFTPPSPPRTNPAQVYTILSVTFIIICHEWFTPFVDHFLLLALQNCTIHLQKKWLPKKQVLGSEVFSWKIFLLKTESKWVIFFHYHVATSRNGGLDLVKNACII